MRVARWSQSVVLAVVVGLAVGGVARAAAPKNGPLVPASQRLAGLTGGQLLGEEARVLLGLPLAENPLAGNGDSCFPAGRSANVLILWTRPDGQAPADCRVKAGTSVFLFGAWVFCDDVEPPPFFAEGEQAQRDCALQGLSTLLDFDAILVTVDGGPPIDIADDRYLAVSPQGSAQLPPDNVLGSEADSTTFVAAGYVAMIRPLRPGRHTIETEIVGGPFAGTTRATVRVVPGT
jgi:hypothetical protein